jgi:hypothetical protein
MNSEKWRYSWRIMFGELQVSNYERIQRVFPAEHLGAGETNRKLRAPGSTLWREVGSFMKVCSWLATKAPYFSVPAFSATHSRSTLNLSQLDVAASRLRCLRIARCYRIEAWLSWVNIPPVRLA